MRGKSIVAIATAVMMWPMTATAASPQLKGTYAFSGMATCLYSGGPFTSNLSPTVWPGFPFPNPSGNGIFTSSFSVEGMRTFNGDGTGSITGTSVDIVGPPSVNPRASVANFTANFTYTLDGNGGFNSQVVPGSFVLTSVLPVAGQVITLDNLNLDGLIGNNRSALTLASTTAVVEKETAQNFAFVPSSVTGGAPITERYRICARARGLILMQPTGKDD
jgi:hypothetical protein